MGAKFSVPLNHIFYCFLLVHNPIEADRVSGDVVYINSLDKKSAKLKAKYGEQVFGLFVPFRVEYVTDHLHLEFIRAIKTELGL